MWGFFLFFAIGLLVMITVLRAIRRIRFPEGAVRRTGSRLTLEDVERLAARGDVIAAIRAYRNLAGVGLEQARTYVESLREVQTRPPPPHPEPPAEPVDLATVAEDVDLLLLVDAGLKTEAVQRVVELSIASIPQARALVDRLSEERAGQPGKEGQA